MKQAFRLIPCLRGAQHRKPVYATAYSSLAHEKVPARKIFVFDPLVDLSQAANKRHGVKHPSSNHIISAYANEFNNRPYNYNDVGEFELHFGASEYRAPPSSSENKSFSHQHHKILIWPEGLELELKANEIPDIYPVISKEQRLTANKLSSAVKKEVVAPTSNNKVVFMIHVTKSQYMERGETVMNWLQEAIEELQQSNPDLKFKSFEYILTLELMHHSGYMTTQIMTMPGNLVLNDALSFSQISKFLQKHKSQLAVPPEEETQHSPQ